MVMVTVRLPPLGKNRSGANSNSPGSHLVLCFSQEMQGATSSPDKPQDTTTSTKAKKNPARASSYGVVPPAVIVSQTWSFTGKLDGLRSRARFHRIFVNPAIKWSSVPLSSVHTCANSVQLHKFESGCQWVLELCSTGRVDVGS